MSRTFLQSRSLPTLRSKSFVTRMVTRGLLAIANLLVYNFDQT